jgi:hypothetical protein
MASETMNLFCDSKDCDFLQPYGADVFYGRQAVDFDRYVCSHWAVENNLHWVLDMAFRRNGNTNGMRTQRNPFPSYKKML